MFSFQFCVFSLSNPTRIENLQDKSDRATVEQVMDPRTRMIIFKMIQRSIFNELNGCISTGKEANVYHATTSTSDKDYAVKVYKTSINIQTQRVLAFLSFGIVPGSSL